MLARPSSTGYLHSIAEMKAVNCFSIDDNSIKQAFSSKEPKFLGGQNNKPVDTWENVHSESVQPSMCGGVMGKYAARELKPPTIWAAFVSRIKDCQEDDGWIVIYVDNEDANLSQVYIIDANFFPEKPVAVITLLPYGFHGTFMRK
ncbi:hypothetical protein AgCh_000925 [Apium graveolens]